jgi:hypothetical protein
MPKREVDQRKTRKALRKLRRAADRAEGEGGPGLTDWEKDFVTGVTTRLEKYGSAFRDPGKGRLEEALSSRQAHVTRAIEKKSRKAAKPSPEPAESDDAAKPAPRPRSTLRAKPRPDWKPRGRDINDDPARAAPATPSPTRASLKLIPGGRKT